MINLQPARLKIRCIRYNVYLENQNPKNSSGQHKNLRYFGKIRKPRFSIEDLGYWFWTRIANPYLTRTEPVLKELVKIPWVLSENPGYIWDPRISAGFGSQGTYIYFMFN